MRGLIRRVIVCVTSSASSRVSAVSVSRSFYWYKLETRDRVYKYTPLSKYFDALPARVPREPWKSHFTPGIYDQVHVPRYFTTSALRGV